MDASWKFCLKTSSHREAELQEGDGIARAWIADPMVYAGVVEGRRFWLINEIFH